MEEAKTDEEIMREVAGGNRDAFRHIVQKYHGRVFMVSYRCLGHYHDAEDVTQEVFMRGFAAARDFGGPGNVYGWLLKIAVNLCLNEMKSARRRTEITKADVADGRSLEEDIASLMMRREVERAIADLPPPQRVALILARYEGLSYGEIARHMGKSVSSVESLLVRARKTLMKKLEKYVDGKA